MLLTRPFYLVAGVATASLILAAEAAAAAILVICAVHWYY